MFNYLEDIIVEAPLDLKTGPKHKTPESGKLFTVNKYLPLMCKEKAELFHSSVARLLFASKQAQTDIQVVGIYRNHHVIDLLHCKLHR